MLVADVMTRSPPVCSPAQPLAAAARIMASHDVAGVPVVDASRRLVGVLSVDDLVRWEASRGDSRGWIRVLERPVLVSHVMCHEVIAVWAGETIAEAARVMRYVARSVLPVFAVDRSLVGIVSDRDIAAASVRSDTSIQHEIQERINAGGNTAPAPGTVNVHVQDGTVTLTGSVHSWRVSSALLSQVAAVVGVSGIRSMLARSAADVADRVAAAPPRRSE